MNRADQYLSDLMFHITTTHLDMGNDHQYVLRKSGFRLVSEIKAWQAFQQPDPKKQIIREITKTIRDKADQFMKEDGTPGPLSSSWGWRDQADTLRQLADEIEKKYGK